MEWQDKHGAKHEVLSWREQKDVINASPYQVFDDFTLSQDKGYLAESYRLSMDKITVAFKPLDYNDPDQGRYYHNHCYVIYYRPVYDPATELETGKRECRRIIYRIADELLKERKFMEKVGIKSNVKVAANDNTTPIHTFDPKNIKSLKRPPKKPGITKRR